MVDQKFDWLAKRNRAVFQHPHRKNHNMKSIPLLIVAVLVSGVDLVADNVDPADSRIVYTGRGNFPIQQSRGVHGRARLSKPDFVAPQFKRNSTEPPSRNTFGSSSTMRLPNQKNSNSQQTDRPTHWRPVSIRVNIKLRSSRNLMQAKAV